MVDMKAGFETYYNAIPNEWLEWSKDFFTLKLAERQKYGTLRNNAYTLYLFTVKYGCARPSDITRQRMVDFVGWLQKRYSLSSVRLHVAKMKHLLKVLMPDFTFPHLTLKRPTPRVLRSDLLSREDILRMIDAASTLYSLNIYCHKLTAWSRNLSPSKSHLTHKMPPIRRSVWDCLSPFLSR